MTKIAIIAGSQRPQSESGKVGRHIASVLESFGAESTILDLGQSPLPLWDEDLGKKKEEWHKGWTAASKTLRAAEGVVIITPEWGGMASPAIKNLLLLASAKELGYKPALLVSVSSGRSGSYPISELRSSGYKNNKILYLPDHLIIRDVENVLNSPADSAEGLSDGDKAIRERVRFSVEVLLHFTRGLTTLRQEPILAKNPFPNGM